MDSGQLVAIIAGIVVVLAIVAVAIILGRKRKAEADRNKAAQIREQAQADEFAAKEREAKAARAEADAQQAEVDAERLRREALDRQHEAESARSGSQEQLRKADELDPDVRSAQRRDARPGEGGTDGGASRVEGAAERPRRESTGLENGREGTVRDVTGDQNRGDKPRNL